MLRLAGFLVAVCPALVVGCATRPDTPPATLERAVVAGGLGEKLDELATRYAAWGFSGTVLVARDDEVLLHKGYGLADTERGFPNTVETRHPALSVTKPIVATAVLRLADRGELDLDAPLATWLGPFPADKSAATLHHLLTHTGGLAVRGSDVGRQDREAFVQAMKDAPFESPPGAERRYSNAGYSLVAAVVEAATGRGWEDVVRAEILVPAGMDATTFSTDPEAPPVAVGLDGEIHAPRPLTLADGPPAMAELWWGSAGAAGIDGTVADLFRWLRALTRGELISPESAERMFTAHVGDQGYGWHIDTAPDGSRRRWKGGGLPMYESKVAWYPDHGADHDAWIVFAVNNHFGWRVPLWRGLETILLGGAVELPPAPAQTLVAAEAFTGRYRLTGGGWFEIEPAGDWIRVTAGDKKAALALGFEDRRQTSGVVLAARPTADGSLVGLQLARREPPVVPVTLRWSESDGGEKALEIRLAGGVTGWAPPWPRVEEAAANPTPGG